MEISKETLQSIKKTGSKVKIILEAFPETRNNDNLLCSTYWREVDGIEDLAGLQFGTPAEAIRRSRQLINAKGLLEATDPDVLEKRKRKAKEMRVGLSKAGS